MAPTQRKVSWKACSTSLPAAPSTVKPPSSAPAVATPRLIDNCTTTDSRLLPLLASAWLRPIRVTVFIAVNCMELTMPISPRCTSSSQVGVCVSMVARLAIRPPSSKVLPISRRR